MSVRSGSVKHFNNEKGYGFIRPDGGGRDIFFLVKDAKAGGIGEPKEGMRVEFDIEIGERGPRAKSLKGIEDAG